VLHFSDVFKLGACINSIVLMKSRKEEKGRKGEKEGYMLNKINQWLLACDFSYLLS